MKNYFARICLLALLLASSSSASASRFVQSGNVGYFWHITDFHYDTNFTTNSENARNSSDFYDGSYDYGTCWDEGAGEFGDFGCDSPWKLVQSALRFVSTYTAENLVGDGGERPFVIWTGDDTSHADNSYFDLDSVLSVIESLTSAISETGLDVYPALGNHDSHPKSQFSTDPRDELYWRTADLWAGWLAGKDGAEEQYRDNGGFYSVSGAATGLPFTLLGLNTNVFYKSNDLVDEDDDDPLGQLSWLESQLRDCRESDTRALIFAHVPPGKFERYYQPYDGEEGGYGFPWFRGDLNDRFLKIIDDYSDVIAGQFYGHHHTDMVKVTGDSSWAALAPALAPMRSTLAPETGATNPALRLVLFDKDTGEILDYVQFWLNLAEANAEGKATWRELYSFLDYYGLRDASAESVSQLVERLETEEETFARYYSANTVAHEEYSNETCDANCRRYHYCAAAHQDYGHFDSCILGEDIVEEDGGGGANAVSGLAVPFLLVVGTFAALAR